jgi:hypothetical protein
LYASPNIIRVIKSRRIRWAGHAECMGEIRNSFNILIGKPERKRLLRRSRRRWEDNIRRDLGNRLGSCWLDACGSGQEAVAGSCEHGILIRLKKLC